MTLECKTVVPKTTVEKGAPKKLTENSSFGHMTMISFYVVTVSVVVKVFGRLDTGKNKVKRMQGWLFVKVLEGMNGSDISLQYALVASL